jgi:hypothetical protein
MIWILVERSILMFSYGVVGNITVKVMENRAAIAEALGKSELVKSEQLPQQTIVIGNNLERGLRQQ